jgi:hypothetical protein
VFKLTLAALGTVLLARALGLGLGPALLAGIAFGFGSYLVDWLMHPHANAYVALPWLFLFTDRLCRTGAATDAAALGATLGVAYLGGQPESALIVSLATAGWLVARLAAARPHRAELARTMVLAGGAVVLGLAIAAVMLLPFIEALRESSNPSRSGPPMPAKAALSIFFPEYWPTTSGPSNFTERTLNVGVLPTMLAAAASWPAAPAGRSGTSPRSRWLPWPSPSTPARCPTSRTISPASTRSTSPASSCWPRSGSPCSRRSGASDSSPERRRERRRMLVAAAVVGVVPALFGIGVYPARLADLSLAIKRMLTLHAPPSADVVALASVLRWLVLAVASLAVLAGLMRWSRRQGVVVAVALGLVALDLLVLGWGYNPAIDKAQADPPAPPAVEVMRRLTDGGGRVVGIDALEPNTASRWGLADARGHEQPSIERPAALWYALGGGASPATEAVAPEDPRTPELLDVFGVRAVLLPLSALRGSELVGAPSLRGSPIAYAGPGGVVAERPSALPPAFVAYRWRTSSSLGESLLRVASQTARQARDAPVIETADASPPGSPLAATPARIVSRHETSVTLDVRARAPGQLVLLDTFYPGWHADVDGRSVPIRPADGAFRAVAVDAGRHHVRFYYRPASVLAGGVISIVGAVALAAFLLIAGARRRRAESVGPR